MKQLILMLSLLPLLALAQIYKSTDADGNTIYTDVPPSENAKEVEFDSLNVSESLKPRYNGKSDGQANSGTPKNQAPTDRYSLLKINSPTSDETLRDNEGKLPVSVTVTPQLYARYDDKLYILVDGNIVNDGKMQSLILENVERGSHTITAYIEDEDGNTIMSAQPVTFHMFRFFKRN